jgi:hypothetical protein
MSDPPSKPVKPTTNRDLTRIFCGVVKDAAENKLWKKGHHKVIVENSAFLLLDKKASKNLDFTTTDSNIIIEEISYHYTDAYESRINHDKV